MSTFYVSLKKTNTQQAWLLQQGQLPETLSAAFCGPVMELSLICLCQYCPDKGGALAGKMPKSDPLCSLLSQVQQTLLISTKHVAILDVKVIGLRRLFLVTALAFLSQQLYMGCVYAAQKLAVCASLNQP